MIYNISDSLTLVETKAEYGHNKTPRKYPLPESLNLNKEHRFQKHLKMKWKRK